MNLRVVTLEEARANAAFGIRHFEEHYPGVFLMAVGLLSAHPVNGPEASEKQAERKKKKDLFTERERTLSVTFGDQMQHARQDHPLAGCTFFLPWASKGQRLVIGRKVSCDLTVPDISISDKHCEIWLDDSGSLVVTDLVSTNGTMVNLKRLRAGVATRLPDQGMLTMGRYCFQFFQAGTLFNALQIIETRR